MSNAHAQSGLDASCVTGYIGSTASNLMNMQRKDWCPKELKSQDFVTMCLGQVSEKCGRETFAVSHAQQHTSAPSPNYAKALAALQADQAKGRA